MWRSWDIKDWGEKLLEHFFLRRQSGDAAPVETLLVTAEELAAATGDTQACPTEVRANFVNAVLSAIGELTVMDHAFAEPWSPEAPEITPPILAHLMLACLAASESTEEFADEGSFIRRLETLTSGRFGRFEEMPHQWRRFAHWLEAGQNPRRYRRLRLPDPGHLTRIGHTVNLAFPDRRDQQVLSGLLAKIGLDQNEPPLAKVISIVSENRADFKRGFLRAFDEFRQQSESGAIENLYRHRFWAAVVAAARRGRPFLGAEATNLKRQVFAWVTDDVATFCVASQHPTAPVGFKTLQLPAAANDYPFAIVPDAVAEISEEALAVAVHATLAGELRVWVVNSCLRGGIIPFGFSSGAQLECLIEDDLDLTTLALVRVDLRELVIRHFGGRVIESSIVGWTVIVDCRLRRLPSRELESSLLARCWLLHATVPRPSLRFTGGIRTEDGWLGYARVLPDVIFNFNAQLVLDAGGAIRPLVRSNGHWELPREDLSGTHSLSAIADGEVLDVRILRFHSSPAFENYKAASAEGAWLCEGVAGTWRLGDEIPASNAPGDAAQWTEFRAFLGANVGEFKPNARDAVWTALRRSGETTVARCDPQCAPAPPESQNTDKGANRRWKKILTGKPAPEDRDVETARNGVWKIVNSSLPKVDHGPAPSWVDYQPQCSVPHPQLEEFVAIVAARGCAVAGIPAHDFHELSRLVLGVRDAAESFLIRAWTESGFIDVAQFARWCSTKIFIRRPKFVIFRDGQSHVAMLCGLALQRTRDVVRHAAITRGLTTWDKRGFGPYTPEVVCIRSSELTPLAELAATTGYPYCVEALDVDLAAKIAAVETRKLAPSGYNVQRVIGNWTINPLASTSATLTLKLRPDAPAIWSVGNSWSYSRNHARLLACSVLKVDAFVRHFTNELEAFRAFLPLPLARVVALVGQALPGPVSGPSTTYRYSFNTERFRQCVEQAVSRSLQPVADTGD